MKRSIVERIIRELKSGQKSIGHIAEEVGVGWKTCEGYLEALKALGSVSETRTKRERLFALVPRHVPFLITIPSVKAPESIDVLNESPPDRGEVEDLT